MTTKRPPPAALMLPEIRAAIVSHVARKDLLKLALVCRGFNEEVTPQLYEHVSLPGRSCKRVIAALRSLSAGGGRLAKLVRTFEMEDREKEGQYMIPWISRRYMLQEDLILVVSQMTNLRRFIWELQVGFKAELWPVLQKLSLSSLEYMHVWLYSPHEHNIQQKFGDRLTSFSLTLIDSEKMRHFLIDIISLTTQLGALRLSSAEYSPSPFAGVLPVALGHSPLRALHLNMVLLPPVPNVLNLRSLTDLTLLATMYADDDENHTEARDKAWLSMCGCVPLKRLCVDPGSATPAMDVFLRSFEGLEEFHFVQAKYSFTPFLYTHLRCDDFDVNCLTVHLRTLRVLSINPGRLMRERPGGRRIPVVGGEGKFRFPLRFLRRVVAESQHLREFGAVFADEKWDEALVLLSQLPRLYALQIWFRENEYFRKREENLYFLRFLGSSPESLEREDEDLGESDSDPNSKLTAAGSIFKTVTRGQTKRTLRYVGIGDSLNDPVYKFSYGAGDPVLGAEVVQLESLARWGPVGMLKSTLAF